MLRLALLLAVASGCKPSGERELVVFAAASLKDVFSELGADFRRAQPGVTITFNFAGTQELRTQLEHGAGADVVASADSRHMDALAAQGLVQAPRPFLRNRLVLAVSREAAPRVHQLEDVATLERIVLAAPEVPLGRYTKQLLEQARATDAGLEVVGAIERHVVSRELSSRQVLARLVLGEAQAAFLYRTDLLSASDAGLGQVPLPADLSVTAEYSIASTARAAHPGLATAWLALLDSAQARAVFQRAGFEVEAGK